MDEVLALSKTGIPWQTSFERVSIMSRNYILQLFQQYLTKSVVIIFIETNYKRGTPSITFLSFSHWFSQIYL